MHIEIFEAEDGLHVTESVTVKVDRCISLAYITRSGSGAGGQSITERSIGPPAFSTATTYQKDLSTTIGVVRKIGVDGDPCLTSATRALIHLPRYTAPKSCTPVRHVVHAEDVNSVTGILCREVTSPSSSPQV
jgi:hypothetical protein